MKKNKQDHLSNFKLRSSNIILTNHKIVENFDKNN